MMSAKRWKIEFLTSSTAALANAGTYETSLRSSKAVSSSRLLNFLRYFRRNRVPPTYVSRHFSQEASWIA